VAAVKAPGFGDRRKALLEDIAILTGGQVIMEGAFEEAPSMVLPLSVSWCGGLSLYLVEVHGKG